MPALQLLGVITLVQKGEGRLLKRGGICAGLER